MPVCCCSFATRPGLAGITASPVLLRCWVFLSRHRHPRQPVYGHGFAAVADAVAGRGALARRVSLAGSCRGCMVPAPSCSAGTTRAAKLLVWTLSAVLCGLAEGRYMSRRIRDHQPQRNVADQQLHRGRHLGGARRARHLIGPVLGAGLVNGAKSISPWRCQSTGSCFSASSSSL